MRSKNFCEGFSIIILMVLFILINSVIAQNKNEVSRLTIEITGFESDEGQAIVTIFDSEKGWLKEPVKRLYQKIESNKCLVEIDSLKFGTYGVTVIHDDNFNSEMDTNFLGIPSEDYGFSNDAEPSFGPAKWKDAKFEINNQQTKIKIKIQ